MVISHHGRVLLADVALPTWHRHRLEVSLIDLAQRGTAAE